MFFIFIFYDFKEAQLQEYTIKIPILYYYIATELFLYRVYNFLTKSPIKLGSAAYFLNHF